MAKLHLDKAAFGYYANQAIRKHFRYAMKFEAAVLRDEDPEAVHQMRVGLRRLRTAVNVFAKGIALPQNVSSGKIGKVMRTLGVVRDYDVMQMSLQDHYMPLLPDGETGKLGEILQSLVRERSEAVEQVEKFFNASLYKGLKDSVQQWSKKPVFTENAYYPIRPVIPDILLPLVAELFLHPGWLVGAEVSPQGFAVRNLIGFKTLQSNLREHEEDLHELRKQIKRVRYQAEFFTDFYPQDFSVWTKELKRAQDVLGWINDTAVLHDFLSGRLHSEWEKELPTVDQVLRQEQLRMWKQWQNIQERYLSPLIRREIRSRIIQYSEHTASAPKAAHAGKAQLTE